MQGKKTAKRKNKRSNFYKRPDRTKNESSRAHSDPRTDTTKFGLEEILIEASNHSDGEAEDVEMM
jgi:hypothetical protein